MGWFFLLFLRYIIITSHSPFHFLPQSQSIYSFLLFFKCIACFVINCCYIYIHTYTHILTHYTMFLKCMFLGVTIRYKITSMLFSEHYLFCSQHSSVACVPLCEVGQGQEHVCVLSVTKKAHFDAVGLYDHK